jgi:hypothetical protein
VRLALEAPHEVRILRQGSGDDLHRDQPPQRLLTGSIHDPHAASPDLGFDQATGDAIPRAQLRDRMSAYDQRGDTFHGRRLRAGPLLSVVSSLASCGTKERARPGRGPVAAQTWRAAAR